MQKNIALLKTQERYERLKTSLLEIGLVLQGSVMPRTILREDPDHPGKMKPYGPYYQWTRKINGRTVIQNLTASQAKVYSKAIRENRKLEDILLKLRVVALSVLELTTESVQKRRRR